eukprot:757153-Hanusia_phi.AAC.11
MVVAAERANQEQEAFMVDKGTYDFVPRHCSSCLLRPLLSSPFFSSRGRSERLTGCVIILT